MLPTSGRLTFRRSHRLTHSRQFRAVYDAKLRKGGAGVFTVFSKPNGLSHHRLGLAVGTVVGPAVVRNLFKRLIRESFRLEQHRLDTLRLAEGGKHLGGMDLIVRVRAGGGGEHRTRGSKAVATVPPTLEHCREMLLELVGQCSSEWDRRLARRKVRPEQEDV